MTVIFFMDVVTYKMASQQIIQRPNKFGVILYETLIVFGKTQKRSQRFYIVMLWSRSQSNYSISAIFNTRTILLFTVRPISFVFDFLVVLFRIVWSPSTGKELCVLLAFRLYCFTLCRLEFFSRLMSGASHGIRLYRFLIISLSSTSLTTGP